MTTADVPQDPAIIKRFTDVIWPTMNQYGPYQAGMARLSPVVDPNLPGGAWNQELGGAIVNMLRGNGYDANNEWAHYREDPKISNVSITANTATNATLKLCYSYTHVWYRYQSDPHQTAPESSEADIQLANVGNTWYLHSISNDHVVPDCQSSKA
ncbi:hypothetical protein [Mycobacteroides abscessus]|uniref:hypothetical protein n=1 Tax=Mycobacteroides abscessus TaxID=36809 RepID=UPI0009A6AEEA|nr:hypothetical protein [Mycobacteroides abscessus]